MDGREQSEPEVTEVDALVAPPAPEAKSRKWVVAAAGVAVAAALGIGAVALNGDDSELDTAQTSEPQDGSETTSSSGGDDLAGTDDEGAMFDEAESADFEIADEAEAMEDSAASFGFGGGSDSSTVFDGERFVSLANTGSGWSVRTSVDGIEWAETQTSGLPDMGHLQGLLFEDGTLITVANEYSETASRQSIATSTDGVSWQTTEIGGVDNGVGEAHVSAAVAFDGQVLVFRNIYEGGGGTDPWQLLSEQGLIDRNAEVEICEVDENGPGELSLIHI